MNAIEYINDLTNEMSFGKDEVRINRFKNVIMNALFLGNVLSYPLPNKTNDNIRFAIAGTKDIQPFFMWEPLELMVQLNNWIKFNPITSAQKSMFYDAKHHMIRYYMRTKRVTDIVKQPMHNSEDVGFVFTIDGKYQFHQPKRYFPNLDAPVGGTFSQPIDRHYNLSLSDLYKFVMISEYIARQNELSGRIAA